MGYNSKELKVKSTAKKLSKPKDVIVDPQGQWKYPGQNTRIDSNRITMDGVSYPVLGVDNLGNQQMMMPNMDYTFPGDFVNEYPQMKKGGQHKIPKNFTNQNIKSSINDLFVRNQLLFGPTGSNRYSPLSNKENMKKSTKLKNYQTGGNLHYGNLNYEDSLKLYNYRKQHNDALAKAQGNPEALKKISEYMQPTSPEWKMADKAGAAFFTTGPSYNYNGMDIRAYENPMPVNPNVAKPVVQTQQPVTQTPTPLPPYTPTQKKFTGFTDSSIQSGYNKVNPTALNINYNANPNTMADGGIAFPQQPTANTFYKQGWIPQGPVGFYAEGGITNEIAYPQQPTAEQFYNRGFIPQGPVGFYQSGGMNTNEIAFPQQPGENYFFSGAPFIPDYASGGMSCYNCGGSYMQSGGNSPGLNMTLDQNVIDNDEIQGIYAKGGNLSLDYIKQAHERAGGSNVGKKTFSNGQPRTGPYAGPSGGAPKGSYPIPDMKHARAALALAHNAPDPSGIKSAVYAKYPDLKKKQDGGPQNDGSQDSYIAQLSNTFKDKLKNNFMKNLHEEAFGQANNIYNQNIHQQMMAQYGMTMDDSYNPNMNFNGMYQDKYNYLMNQQKQAGQNFMNQTANVIQQKYAQNGDAGKPNDQDYQDFLAYQEFIKHKQNNNIPAPTYQAGYNTNQWQVNNANEGNRYLPYNTHDNSHWETKGIVPGLVQLKSGKVNYGGLDRFLGAIRGKDSNGQRKHTFGPKSIEFNFDTYTDPMKVYTDAQGPESTNTQNTINTPDYSKYVGLGDKPKVLGNKTDQEISDIIKNAAYKDQIKRMYGGLAKAQNGLENTNFLDMGAFGHGFAGQPDFMDNTVDNYRLQYNPNGTHQAGSAKWNRDSKVNGEDSANWIMSGVAGLTAGLNSRDTQNTKNKMMKNTLADNQFNAQPSNRIQNQGRYNWTGMSNGMMDPNSMDVIQQPGIRGFANGGQYEEGGEYELTQDEIDTIEANGGSVTYLD